MSTTSSRSTAPAASGGRARAALAWEPPVQDLAALARSTPFLATVLLFLTFPILALVPKAGPDPSWQAGLYMALDSGLQFGREFVFTYGPLGFLHVPTVYGGGLSLLAIAFSIALRYALIASLLWTARRALPLLPALIACYLILVVGHLNSAPILITFLWAFAAVGPAPPRHAERLLALGGGFFAALELLGKINYGVSIFALCLVALAVLPRRRRNLSAFGATFIASILALWLLTGQALANLPAYLSNSVQMVSGYSQAMGIAGEPKAGEITLSLAAVAVLVDATFLVTRRDRRLLRCASLLLFALFAFFCFKQDFIRPGLEGRADFSLMMAAAAIAIAARLPTGARLSRPRVAAGALIAPMIVFIFWAGSMPPTADTLAPGVHVTAFREALETIANPSYRHAERNLATRELRHAEAVPPRILHRLGDRPVAIEPWEIGVAWAYGLDWKPLPVIQDYSAYTPSLDRLNATALEAGEPAMVLRRDLRDAGPWSVASVDGRYPAWEAPAAKLALLCNYAEVETSAHWQLLEKTANRCGPVRSLGNTRAETGAPIDVPRAGADEVVFARFGGLGPDLAERLETLAYRAPGAWASFDGGHRWTLDTATVGDGLIMSAPAGVDYARPFQLAPNPRTFQVGIDGAGTRPITVSWYSERVAPRRAGDSPRAATTN